MHLRLRRYRRIVQHPGAAFSGPCEVAKAMLKEINERVAAANRTPPSCNRLVQEYGEAVLAAPPVQRLQ